MKRLACPVCYKHGIIVQYNNPEFFICVYCRWQCGRLDTVRTQLIQEANAVIPRVSPGRQGLHITDESWAWFTQTGRALGYIRAIYNANGINAFFVALSKLAYTDARPEFMQNTGQWCTGLAVPRIRLVRIADDTAAALRRVADAHGIVPYTAQRPVLNGTRPYIKDVSPLYSDTAYASVCLEAIGLRWLRSVEPLEPAPAGLFRQPPRKSRAARAHTGNYYTF